MADLKRPRRGRGQHGVDVGFTFPTSDDVLRAAWPHRQSQISKRAVIYAKQLFSGCQVSSKRQRGVLIGYAGTANQNAPLGNVAQARTLRGWREHLQVRVSAGRCREPARRIARAAHRLAPEGLERAERTAALVPERLPCLFVKCME
jgi:hypothetical protein